MHKPMRRQWVSYLLLLGVALAAAWSGLAAGTGGGGTQELPKVNPFALVKDNLDPVFYVILFCSIVGVTLIIQGFIKARGSVLFPETSTVRMRALIEAGKHKELMEYTRVDPTFVAQALNAALKRTPNFEAMKEAMETAVAEQTSDQFRRIEYLNIIGNLGPLLGLLGTVWGMIDAFQQMYMQGGEAAAGTLANGISKALCHTLLGLMLALPCLAAFGVLRTLVDRLTVRGAMLAEELLLLVKPREHTDQDKPAGRIP
jgi:biopolymer transport protein ExbB